MTKYTACECEKKEGEEQKWCICLNGNRISDFGSFDTQEQAAEVATKATARAMLNEDILREKVRLKYPNAEFTTPSSTNTKEFNGPIVAFLYSPENFCFHFAQKSGRLTFALHLVEDQNLCKALENFIIDVKYKGSQVDVSIPGRSKERGIA